MRCSSFISYCLYLQYHHRSHMYPFNRTRRVVKLFNSHPLLWWRLCTDNSLKSYDASFDSIIWLYLLYTHTRFTENQPPFRIECSNSHCWVKRWSEIFYKLKFNWIARAVHEKQAVMDFFQNKQKIAHIPFIFRASPDFFLVLRRSI